VPFCAPPSGRPFRYGFVAPLHCGQTFRQRRFRERPDERALVGFIR
jgi:hypothetical protein